MMDSHLREEVIRTRREILEARAILEGEDWPNPLVSLSLNSQGVRILDCALRGEVNTREIRDYLAVVAEVIASRRRGGDHRYVTEHERWWAVFRQLLVEAETQEMPPPDPLLTIQEVAAYLSVSRATVENLIYGGELPSVKFGRNRRVAKSDLDSYIQRKREESRG